MTINGRAFVGNTPVFRARVGETVQWDVLSLGDDFHTFHVHGHRWRTPDGAVRDTQVVGPAESYKIRWREDAPGTWLYHCHVESHMMNGHDRHLPGDADERSGLPRRSSSCALRAGGGWHARARPTRRRREVAIPGKAYEPARITVLSGRR